MFDRNKQQGSTANPSGTGEEQAATPKNEFTIETSANNGTDGSEETTNKHWQTNAFAGALS